MRLLKLFPDHLGSIDHIGSYPENPNILGKENYSQRTCFSQLTYVPIGPGVLIHLFYNAWQKDLKLPFPKPNSQIFVMVPLQNPDRHSFQNSPSSLLMSPYHGANVQIHGKRSPHHHSDRDLIMRVCLDWV